jgi:glutamate N-acetyltransferase/amino-acid N-acetyltransferase
VTELMRYPRGFKVAGVSCGIKSGGKRDLALIYSVKACEAAAMFTTNTLAAAPVLVSKKHLLRRAPRAIVANSGNANACTGDKGMEDALEMAHAAAKALGLADDEVLVCSTGLIGERLPMDRIRTGITLASQDLSPDHWPDAANAIMTTDTRPKVHACEMEHDGKSISMLGVAKGAGMIHPRLATMLAFIATDASISRDALRQALRAAVDLSFNAITVDGDTSTNDSVIVLANGAAGNTIITPGSSAFRRFEEALTELCQWLGREIARDGEGATKLVEIVVSGASSVSDARRVAMTVARSNLVKTALFGCDPNWGRIACAVGYSGVQCAPQKLTITMGQYKLFANGSPLAADKIALKTYMKLPEIRIEIQLNTGAETATVWTCDLSEDYVRLNAEYST